MHFKPNKQLILQSDLHAFGSAIDRLDNLEIKIMDRVKKARGLANRPELLDLSEGEPTFRILFDAFADARVLIQEGESRLEDLHKAKVKIGQEAPQRVWA